MLWNESRKFLDGRHLHTTQSRGIRNTTKPENSAFSEINDYANLLPAEVTEKKASVNIFEDPDLVTFRDKRIRDVLSEKVSRDLRYINQNKTVFDAIQEMSKHKIGALVVKNDREETVGIITERDYLNKIALAGLKSQATLVKTIITAAPKTVPLNATVLRCLALMTHYRFRHLIVLDPQTQDVVGIVSIGDLVKAVIEQYKETIFFLREYIEKRW